MYPFQITTELNVRNLTPSNSEEKKTKQISRENKVFKVPITPGNIFLSQK